MTQLDTYRKEILSILEEYNGSKIKLKDTTPSMLKEVIFNKDGEVDNRILEIYTKEEIFNFLQKIDLSNFSFDNINITNINLKGNDIKINPQTIKNKSLENTILMGIEFIGPFNDVNLKNTAIISCKGVSIDPDTVYNKSLEHTIIQDGTFTKPFNKKIKTEDFAYISGNKIKILKK